MKKTIKTTLCVIFNTVLVAVSALPNLAFAAEVTNANPASYNESQQTIWEKEVVVEVSSEEEFLRYPKNPNFRYTFIFTSPSSTRAVCYMCGRPNMSTMTYKDQASGLSKACPTDGGWGTDMFYSWNNYTYERCTACGYKGSEWLSQVTYTAQCRNGDSSWDGEDWVVRYEYTQSNGYNLHQSLRYWTEGSQLR